MDWTEAAQLGNIDALYELFHEDPHLLDRIDEVPSIHTPLHQAAAAGQFDFAMEMMNLKPSFATKLNPDGFTPMHLALQNPQTHQLLFQLLKINKDLVRVKGKKGMTLLHYAAEQGDIDVLAKFLVVCPPCIQDVTVGGKTALHIAAENNQVEALELLARWLRRTHNRDGRFWEKEVMNWKDREGNTVLHVAASPNIQNQPKMISLLLECGVQKNIINFNGLTALDVLKCQSLVDNKEAVDILLKAGGSNASSVPKTKPLAELFRFKVGISERSMIFITRARLNIPSDSRNAFLVLAGWVITTTYQAIFNPPGGVRQAEATGSSGAGRSIIGIYVGKCKVSNPENGEEKEIDNAVIHFFGHNSKLTSDEQCKRCYPPYDEIDNPVIDLKKATSQQCERCFLPSDENGEEKEKRKAVTNLFALLKKEATSQECESCFPPSKNGGVSITCLDCFLGGKSLYVYEYHVCYLKLLFKQSGTCTVHRSKPPDEVIQTAFALLKENSFGEYHLYENNCEDFATYCKTGKPTSNQVAGNLYGFCLCGIVTYNAKKDRNPLPHFCLPFCGALSVPCQCMCKYGMYVCCHLFFDC